MSTSTYFTQLDFHLQLLLIEKLADMFDLHYSYIVHNFSLPIRVHLDIPDFTLFARYDLFHFTIDAIN